MRLVGSESGELRTSGSSGWERDRGRRGVRGVRAPRLEIARTLKALIDSGRLQHPQPTLTFIRGVEITMRSLWKGQNRAAFANTRCLR